MNGDLAALYYGKALKALAWVEFHMTCGEPLAAHQARQEAITWYRRWKAVTK